MAGLQDISRPAKPVDSRSIARAIFTAAYLRNDPTLPGVTREQVTTFLNNLEKAINDQFTDENVKTCSIWIVKHVAGSAGRVQALGKYMVVLSESATAYGNTTSKSSAARGPSVRRRRLFMLHLVNDFLHNAQYHRPEAEDPTDFATQLQGSVENLFTEASKFNMEAFPKYHKRLLDLIDLWKERGYYGQSQIEKFERIVNDTFKSLKDGEQRDSAVDGNRSTSARTGEDSQAWNLPEWHGDHDTPWYDLPAACLAPHINPGSKAPLDPVKVKPIKVQGQQASAEMIDSVKQLMAFADEEFDEPNPYMRDSVAGIDAVGQTLQADPAVGKTEATDNYYGWSTDFCDRMKQGKNYGVLDDSDEELLTETWNNTRWLSQEDESGYESGRGRRSGRGRGPRRDHGGRNSSGSSRRSGSRSGAASPKLEQNHRPGLGAAPQGFVRARQNSSSVQTPSEQISNPFSNAQPTPPPPPSQGPAHIPPDFWPRDSSGRPYPPPPQFHSGPWPPNLGHWHGDGQFPAPPPPPAAAGSYYPGVHPPPPPPNVNSSWPPQHNFSGSGQQGPPGSAGGPRWEPPSAGRGGGRQ